MNTSNNKPRLGVDFDDVVFGFMDGFLEFSEKVFGERRKKEDIFSFYLEDVWGVTPEEMTKRIDAYYHSDFHNNGSPVPGALESLSKISKQYDIYVITGSPKDILPWIKDWFKNNNIDFISEIHCTRDTMNDLHSRKKIDIAREIGISYMIDDASHVAEQFVDSGINFFLMSQPWNKDFNMDHVMRVDTWKEIEEKILPINI